MELVELVQLVQPVQLLELLVASRGQMLSDPGPDAGEGARC